MHYPFSPINLPYEKSSLEPFISSEIVYYHYCRHYISYIETVNHLLVKFSSLHHLSIEELIVFIEKSCYSYKDDLLTAAGGVYNHQLYYKCLSPNKCSLPENEILFAIKRDFGSYNNFLDCFSKIAYDFVGSGYVWLINDSCKLEIITTQNQNTPLSNSVIPLLHLDLWEHAYYLQYKNRKNTYIDNWFKLVNWNYVNQRYISMH